MLDLTPGGGTPRVPSPSLSSPQILIVERCLLHTLGFQLTVEHPYSAVMGLLKRLFTLGRGADGGKGVDRALNRQLSQVREASVLCLFFVNTAVRTPQGVFLFCPDFDS